jgi:hypothetical protein
LAHVLARLFDVIILVIGRCILALLE